MVRVRWEGVRGDVWMKGRWFGKGAGMGLVGIGARILDDRLKKWRWKQTVSSGCSGWRLRCRKWTMRVRYDYVGGALGVAVYPVYEDVLLALINSELLIESQPAFEMYVW